MVYLDPESRNGFQEGREIAVFYLHPEDRNGFQEGRKEGKEIAVFYLHPDAVFYLHPEAKNGFQEGRRKGKEIEANPFGTILFCWLELERQIRIEGSIEKIDRSESLAYFISRPKESQIGAWASPQSQPIANRSILEERQSQISEQYAEAANLPLPENWGGYRLKPDYFEFWQGRESRLHDRIFYQMINHEWKIGRLAP